MYIGSNSSLFLLQKMESFSGEPFSLPISNYFVLLFIRPIAAVLFTLSLLFLGWLLAWKLVLVHVPLVQEIFRLKEKPSKPKPADRRKLTRFYNSINAQMNSTSRE